MKLVSSILAAGALAALFLCTPAAFDEGTSAAHAATTPRDSDLFYRRFRGDDEVSDDERGGKGRGRGRGRGGDGDDQGGGGGDKGKGKGKDGGGKQGGGDKSNPNDSGDRFGN